MLIPRPRRRAKMPAPLVRVAPYLLAVTAAGVSVLALLPEPPTEQPPPKADFAIVVGVAGLRWDDVDRVRTPALWRLAEQGAMGALSVRSAGRTTCPADGWLTLGAGNRARRTAGPVDGQCPPMQVGVDRTTAGGAMLPDQRDVVRDNRELAWEVQPGALAEAVRCTTAIGPGAAIAAARPFGRVDRYQPTAGPGLTAQLTACSLSLIDAGTVSGTGADRLAGAQAADTVLAAVLAARPQRSLMIVAGLSDTADGGRLHVAVADGPGYPKGWLTSSTTGRPGYLQLVDLAPTVLAALDRPVPKDLFSGAVVGRVGERPARLAASVAHLADADRQGGVQRVVAARFLVALALGQIGLFLALIPILHRVRRPVGDRVAGEIPVRLRVLAEVLLVAAALAVPAALVADLVPWWRLWPASLVFIGVTLVVLTAATTGVVLVTRRQRVIGPIGLVAAVAAVAVVADVMTGSRLQLNGVAGYSAATSGRYSGLGTVGLGVVVGGLLLLAGAVAARVSRPWRPGVVGAIGALGAVVVGSPYLGADAAGAVALSAGVCVAVAMVTGGWLTSVRLFAAVVTAAVVTTGFALLDLTRPAAQRSNVGRFLIDLGDGTGGLAGERLGAHNVTTIATSPLTLLAVGSGLFVWFVLLTPSGGLRRLFGLYPAVRATCVGGWVATLFAGLVEGVGLNVLGAASATAVPLAALGALRVLIHANDRTGLDDRARCAPERCDMPPPETRVSGEVLA